MHTTKIKLLFIIGLIVSISFLGCNMFDSEDITTHEEEMKELLPYTQYLTAYWMGTDNARFPLQWMQQISGVRNLHLRVDKYELASSELNTVWNVYYQYIIPNLETIILHADDLDAIAYRGIANILKVYTSGMMTDAWGDIPYENPLTVRPAYDNQEIILMQNLELLNQAISDLNQAENILPGTVEDPIFHGDLKKWEKAANLLKLRLHLKIANVNGNYESLIPILENQELPTGNQDNLVFHFEGGERVNPHYYFDTAIKNTRVGSFLLGKLEETNDPRLQVFVKKNIQDAYEGSAPGEGQTAASNLGSALAGETSPVAMLSFAELKFIEAEVYLRANQQAKADLAYSQAVQASLEQYDITAPDWEEDHAQIENVSLEQIITGKYIALFLNPEVWSDYRRTGYPTLTPYEDSSQGIPRRLLYPQDEFANNPNNVPQDVDIFSRIWWDVQ